MEKKIVGILGGMGPLATADLFKKIVMNTRAATDGEHLRVLVDSNPAIPDRTEAILRDGESPVPRLRESAALLCSMGAALLVMPCNTAHHFLPEVRASVSVPVLDMIGLTAAALARRGVRRAGLLATEGTVCSGLYQRALTGCGIEVLTPAERQAAINDLIYRGVKAGNAAYNTAAARAVMDSMLADGAEVLILGCTELPLAMELYRLEYPVCDPTLELAKGAIIAAGGVCV